MGISKGKRFEIFKRDGFTCQYCGQRPPSIVLEVDHIDPKSKGGSDEDINLITSCFDCNRGKSDKKLGDGRPKPDADLKYLETQQEILEAKRYLECQKQLSDLREQIIDRLLDVWDQNITSQLHPLDSQWRTWLSFYSPEEIEYGLVRAGVKFHKPGGFGISSPNYILTQVVKYISGVMRNVREQAEDRG